MGQSRAGMEGAVLFPDCLLSLEHHSQLLQVRTASRLMDLGQKITEQ